MTSIKKEDRANEYAEFESGRAAQAPEPRLDAYDAAVKAYAQGGDITQAVMPLQGFTSRRFDAAIERIIVRKDNAFTEAAAMFQLEVGIGVIGLSAAAAAGHFDLGEKLLESTMPSGARRAETVRELHETVGHLVWCCRKCISCRERPTTRTALDREGAGPPPGPWRSVIST